MASSYSSSWHRSQNMGRPYWLPPSGIGNGLDALTWAALVDADTSILILLLDILSKADIAAHAAGWDRRVPTSVFRIWVDTWTHSRAEDVIRKVLLRYRPPDGP